MSEEAKGIGSHSMPRTSDAFKMEIRLQVTEDGQFEDDGHQFAMTCKPRRPSSVSNLLGLCSRFLVLCLNKKEMVSPGQSFTFFQYLDCLVKKKTVTFSKV
jgi:hypothetical protein